MQHPAYGPAHLIDGVGHPNPELVRHDRIDVGGQAGNVTSPAGAGHVRSRDAHAGARHPALVDSIAQRDVDEGAERAHVTHSGEASQQGIPRIARTRQRLLGTGPRQQFRVPVATVGFADQVSVTVDHAGQHRLARQVHESRTFGRCIASCDNIDDAVAIDDDSAVRSSSPVTTSSSRRGRITVRMEMVILQR